MQFSRPGAARLCRLLLTPRCRRFGSRGESGPAATTVSQHTGEPASTSTLSSSAPQRRKGRRLGAAVWRPEIDLDYLLDEKNVEEIRKNIRDRKGVGDIDAVHAAWQRIEAAIEGREKPPAEADYAETWDTLYNEALRIPNRTYPGVPRGGEEKARVVDMLNPNARRDEPKLQTAEQFVKSWRCLYHPTEASGQRSYAFLGPLARLERALLDFAYARVEALGFRPVVVPDLVPRDVGAACGVTAEGMQYTLDSDPSVALSGTAEMGIAAMLRVKHFPAEQLPLRFVSQSRCFRPEISKSASEAKLYRVHEFSKVEMFVVCSPEESERELAYLLETQKDIVRELGLHARVLEMPTEELGASAAHKFDIEAWMPGRRLFGEISSASNCSDYQAARLGIRYIDRATGQRHLTHTCNGTALATPRAMIAVVETHQDEKRKGSLKELPEAIRTRVELRDEQGNRIREAKIKFQTAPPFVPF